MGAWNYRYNKQVNPLFLGFLLQTLEFGIAFLKKRQKDFYNVAIILKKGLIVS